MIPARCLEPSGLCRSHAHLHIVSFCPQGNDVRIILGQFDQNMAAKVFCCVSNTLVVSWLSLGRFMKRFLALSVTAWSLSGPESGVLEAEVLFSLLFHLSVELKPQDSEQCSCRRNQEPQFTKPTVLPLLQRCQLVLSLLHPALLNGAVLCAPHRGRHQIPGRDREASDPFLPCKQGSETQV